MVAKPPVQQGTCQVLEFAQKLAAATVSTCSWKGMATASLGILLSNNDPVDG